MPLYEMLCQNGHKFDRFIKLSNIDEPQTCECNAQAHRVISACMFSIDATNFPAYQSPTTGRIITSKTQRREDITASGCVDYEPSLIEHQAKRVAREDAELDKKVDEHIEKTIYEMPAAKKERLAAEIEHFDVDVARL
jgi:putative FmdB family regulatory protein